MISHYSDKLTLFKFEHYEIINILTLVIFDRLFKFSIKDFGLSNVVFF